MSPPTFNIVVEIQDRDRVAVHPDVSQAVDAALRSQLSTTEVRWLDETGEITIKREEPVKITEKSVREAQATREQAMPRLYPFGINRVRLEQVAREMHLVLNTVDNLSEADLIVTSKSYYRRRPQKIRDAEAANLPIYVLRKHTPVQLRQMLSTIQPAGVTSKSTGRTDMLGLALREAEEAANKLRESQEETVELSPQSAYIRRLQHLIAERSKLSSKSTGKEPNRRVRIYKAETKV
jgi:hypothetical protein